MNFLILRNIATKRIDIGNYSRQKIKRLLMQMQAALTKSSLATMIDHEIQTFQIHQISRKLVEQNLIVNGKEREGGLVA